MSNSDYTSVLAEPEAEQPQFKPITLTDFVQAPVGRRRWAIDGIWPEGASGVIAGAPKSGKSTLSLELAVALATGTPFLGLQDFRAGRPPARVTYIQAENSTERVRRDLDEILVARGLGFMEEVWDDRDPDAEAPVGFRFRPMWEGALEPGGWEPDLQILSNPGLDLSRAEDRDWLIAHASGRDYVILDPIYLLGLDDPNETRAAVELLRHLTAIKDASGCALILTHQQTDKRSNGTPASRMIGSTFLHGWYEGAIFCERRPGGSFTFRVDQLREMGEERKYVLQGQGVGNWFYVPGAQDATDSLGRTATRTMEKDTRVAQFAELIEEHGANWTNKQYAEAMELSVETIKRYRRELEADETGGGSLVANDE